MQPSAPVMRTLRPLGLLVTLLSASLAGCIAYQEPEAGPAPAELVAHSTLLEAASDALRSPADGSARYGSDDFVLLSTARSASGGVAGYVYTVPEGAMLHSDGEEYLALLSLPVGDGLAFGDDWMLLAFAAYEGDVILAGALVSSSYEVTQSQLGLGTGTDHVVPSDRPRLLTLWGGFVAPGDDVYLVFAARGDAGAETGLMVSPMENDDARLLASLDEGATTGDFLAIFGDPRPHVPFNPGRAEGALFAHYIYSDLLLTVSEAKTADVSISDSGWGVGGTQQARQLELSSRLDREAGWSLTFGLHIGDGRNTVGTAGGTWELEVDQFGRSVQTSGIALGLPFSHIGGVTEQPFFSIGNEGQGDASSRFRLDMVGASLDTWTWYEHFAVGAPLEHLVGVASSERLFVGPHLETSVPARPALPAGLTLPGSGDDLVLPGPHGVPIIHVGLGAHLGQDRLP